MLASCDLHAAATQARGPEHVLDRCAEVIEAGTAQLEAYCPQRKSCVPVSSLQSDQAVISACVRVETRCSE